MVRFILVWLFENETSTIVKQSPSIKKKIYFLWKAGTIVLQEQSTITAKWYADICPLHLVLGVKDIRQNLENASWQRTYT